MFFPIFILSSYTLHLHASSSFLLIRSFHSWICLTLCVCHPGQPIAKIMLPTELGEKESNKLERAIRK